MLRFIAQEHNEAEFKNVQFCLRSLGILLRVLRLEVSVYNVEVTVNSKEGKLLRLFSQFRPRIRPPLNTV